MADDTPAAPPPVDPWSMTPDQATAALAVMDAKLHPPPPINPTTPAEARARLDQLTDNKEWGARWVAGGIAEAKEYARLSELADQVDEVKNAIEGATPPQPLIETTTAGQLNQRDLTTTVEMLRTAGLPDDVVTQALRGGKVSRAEYAAARALKSARHGDAAWTDRWLKGGWAEGREQWLLNTILTSEIDESR